MKEAEELQTLGYAQGHLMVRPNRLAPVAFTIALLVSIGILALAQLPNGAWLRWRSALFSEERVWHFTLVVSALSFALAVTGLWLVRYRKAPRKQWAVAALALSIFNPALAQLSGFPAHRHKHYTITRCLSHLTTIRTATMLYAIHSGGTYPDTIEEAFGELGSSEALICPFMSSTETAAPSTGPVHRHSSYIYCGRGLNSSTVTPATVIAFDRPHNHDEQDYDLWVLYGDGSIRSMPRAKLELLIAEIKAGYNPPRSK